MVSKLCCAALAATVVFPGFCRAAPADPYAKFYETMTASVRQDCRTPGAAETAQMRQMQGTLSPHQMADLSAHYYGQCISYGMKFAEEIYVGLHFGNITKLKLKTCLDLLRKTTLALQEIRKFSH